MRTLGQAFFMAFLINSMQQIVTATVYYVDATNGNDNNGGTSEVLAWKTIAKVNSLPFLAGDKILFKRGNTWRETLRITRSGSAGDTITFGAFGAGPKPRILGSALLTSWILDSGSIWKSPITATVNSSWFLETGGKVSWGHKQTSKAACVNEYDWHSDGSFVYVYSPTNPHNRYSGVEAGIRSYAIYAEGKSYITIDGIETSYCEEAGIKPESGSTYWTIQNCLVSCIGSVKDGSRGRGIWISASSNATVQDNIVHDIARSGIWVWSGASMPASSNFLVQRNIVYNAYHSNIDIIVGTGGTINGGTVRYNLCYQGADYDTSITDGALYYAEGKDSIHKLENIDFYYNVGYNVCFKAMQVNTYCSNIRIYSNSFYNKIPGVTAIGGIRIDGGTTTSGVVIENNICMDVQGGCLWVNNPAQVSVCDYNCWYQSAGGTAAYANVNGTSYYYSDFVAYKTATGWDKHSKWEDPKFVDAASHNFRLQSGSSCIDAGTCVGLAQDFYGNNVPFGPGVDIGASEYIGSVPALTTKFIGFRAQDKPFSP